MPSDKTKKLLEGLGKITDSAPKQFEQKFTVVSNQFLFGLLCDGGQQMV